MNPLKKIKNIIEIYNLSYQIGFITPHEKYSQEKINELSRDLEQEDLQTLDEYEKKFSDQVGNGTAISFAAGRMAFYSFLKAMNIGKGDEVILPAFTCSVMPNAVLAVEAKPIFCEINRENLGNDPEDVAAKITNKTKAVVAQHSFGIPCKIEELKELCDEKGVFLLEDCAISFDSSVKKKKIGTFGDAAIFSTDHSKPINTVIGGILYSEKKEIAEKIRKIQMNSPELEKNHQKRLFERFLFENSNIEPQKYPKNILNTYKDAIFRRLGIMEPKIFLEEKCGYGKNWYPCPAKFPSILAAIGLAGLANWKAEKTRRKKILSAYLKEMEERQLDATVPEAYFDKELDITPLRFAFLKDRNEQLLNEMEKYFDTSWIWFRKPVVGCLGELEQIGYEKGNCPRAEEICNNIVNLPCAIASGWETKAVESFGKAIEAQKNKKA